MKYIPNVLYGVLLLLFLYWAYPGTKPFEKPKFKAGTCIKFQIKNEFESRIHGGIIEKVGEKEYLVMPVYAAQHEVYASKYRNVYKFNYLHSIYEQVECNELYNALIKQGEI